MNSLLNALKLCRPRPDVKSGVIRHEQFPADLAQVMKATAAPEYSDPTVFSSARIRPPG